MRARRDQQEQEGGDGSVNFQAGGDIVLSSSTREEIRDTVLAVFHENFMDLRGIAEEIAIGRAEKITNDFLAKLEIEAPEKVSNFREPDMQRAMYTAQREYACSGEEDLGEVLVDLLVDRVKEDGRSLRTLALNEAINAAPKLTDSQRQAVAVAFLMKYTGYGGPVGLEGYFDGYIRSNVAPLIEGLPTRDIDYQHIEYVGAGTVSMGAVAFADVIREGAEGFFTRGFLREELPEWLSHPQQGLRQLLCMPCLRDESRLQLSLAGKYSIDRALEGLEEVRGQMGGFLVVPPRDVLVSQLEVGLMTGEEVVADLIERVPEMATLQKSWETTALKNMTLTSVGIALGYAYWRRTTGGAADLGIWL